MKLNWISEIKKIPDQLNIVNLNYINSSALQNSSKDVSKDIIDIFCFDEINPLDAPTRNFFVWLQPTDLLDTKIYKTFRDSNQFLGTLGPFLDQEQIDNIIESTQDRTIKNLRQIQIIQKAKNQNLQIENQVKNLNTEVEQKTQELFDYRLQLESRVSFEKDSILILKNLLEASSFFSFHKIMINSFKPYQVQNFILFYKNPSGQYCIQSESERLKKYNFSFDQMMDMDKFNWANISSNPVLEFRLYSIGENNDYYLGFEFSTFSLEHLNIIQEHLNYLQFIFKMVLDYLYDKDKIIKDSSLWSSSFDSLDDPILIIDSFYKVVKSNIKSHQKGQNCFKALFDRSSPCDNCPIKANLPISKGLQRSTTNLNDYNLHSFPVELSDDLDHRLWIHHYESVASINELKAQYIKSEKFSYLGQLVDKVIHQIANPLTGMKSSVEFMLSKNPKELEEDLTEIQNGVLRCFEIINNLKEFSKSEVNLTKVELSQIVDRTLILMKSITRDIDIETEDLAGVYVHCPNGLVQQVLFNMIFNSCQAMNYKGLVKLKSYKEDGFINLIVSDSGPGISPSLNEKVFDPFFSTKPKDQGTGIGLFLSRQILRQFGGDLIVLNNLSPGAQLCIKFPIRT